MRTMQSTKNVTEGGHEMSKQVDERCFNIRCALCEMETGKCFAEKHASTLTCPKRKGVHEMSDITKRQAYVFLKVGDVVQDGDEWWDRIDNTWNVEKTAKEVISPIMYRRPIVTPEQTDVLTVWDRFAYDVCIHLNNGHHNEATEVLMKWQEMMKARATK
jgi:hypothetical protein